MIGFPVDGPDREPTLMIKTPGAAVLETPPRCLGQQPPDDWASRQHSHSHLFRLLSLSPFRFRFPVLLGEPKFSPQTSHLLFVHAHLPPATRTCAAL